MWINARDRFFGVIASKGGNVNTEATGMYKENSSIELAAIPEKGYVFAGWMSENGGTFENVNDGVKM